MALMQRRIILELQLGDAQNQPQTAHCRILDTSCLDIKQLIKERINAVEVKKR